MVDVLEIFVSVRKPLKMSTREYIIIAVKTFNTFIINSIVCLEHIEFHCNRKYLR